ncbi:MAG TPA: hypothetical protein VFB16_01920 [Bauldia sp.]|nr:hypothetical protein [Bauldia sp.]
MPRVTLVRYTAKPGRAEENEALSKAVFAELHKVAPGHVAYGLFRDGDSFLHLFVNTVEDDSSAVTELPSFKAFGANISERTVTPPETTRIAYDLVASYGLAVTEPA